MLPKTILSFLINNQSQVKKVFKKKTRRNFFKFLLALIIPLASLYLLAPDVFNTALNYGQKNIGSVLVISTTADPKIDQEKFNKPKKINENIIIEQIEWKITNVTDLKNNIINENDKDYCRAGDGNKIISVKYTIRNIDKDLLAIPKFGIKLYDSNKTEYDFSKKAYKCISQITNPFSRLAPVFLTRDKTKDFEIIYELPSDKSDLKIKVGDLSILTDNFEYVDLGI